MQGLTPSSLKKHPALIPLYVCLGVGVAMAAFYTFRLAVKNPDVQWNKKKDPNEEYRNKQYKFYNQHIDWSTYQNPAPRYTDDE
ncbi:NADH-ubiquinone reductase complex 1 MLRQ subunit [Trinorchestia longiramus]|nr:NADH-ubiquinone reductase complex 1 MLRQ subunit [Trinorchestia longiramus]